jgi:hypothetical protein
MFDIIIRNCGYGEWLPLIVVSPHCGSVMQGKELYRGERQRSYEAASLRAKTAWEEGTTQNIRDYKEQQGL